MPWQAMTRNWRTQASTNLWQRLPNRAFARVRRLSRAFGSSRTDQWPCSNGFASLQYWRSLPCRGAIAGYLDENPDEVFANLEGTGVGLARFGNELIDRRGRNLLAGEEHGVRVGRELGLSARKNSASFTRGGVVRQDALDERFAHGWSALGLGCVITQLSDL